MAGKKPKISSKLAYLKQISSINSSAKALGRSSEQRKLIGVVILLFVIFIIFFLIWNPFLDSRPINKLKTNNHKNFNSGHNVAAMDNILLRNIRKLEKLQMQAKQDLPSFKSGYFGSSANLDKLNSKADKQLQARLHAPTSVYENSTNNINNNFNINNKPDSKYESKYESKYDSKYESKYDSELAHKAIFSMIKSPEKTIAQGTIIFANLESAINSELPGMLRAVVSEPAYAYRGDNILIPKGSRLIGKYTSTLANGSASNRLFIIWQRIITPNGLSINIEGSAIDSLGRVGLGADKVNHHFWRIFGTSALLSVIGAGAASFDVSGNTQPNSANQYQQAVASSLQQSAGSTLSSNMKIKPTLLINQGSAVRVFVAHDLEFN